MRNHISTYTMTLSVKMLKLSKSGLVLFALIPFFFACDDPSSEGIVVDEDNSNTSTRVVELTLPMSTIYIDSLLTQQFSGRELLPFLNVGSVQDDPVYGDLKAIAYSEYGLTGGSGVIPRDSLEFVRAFVVLQSNGQPVIKDGASMQEISVYESTDTLFSTAFYLSNFHLEYDETKPIGFISEPISEQDSIFGIVLDDSFGRGIYRRLFNANNTNDVVFEALNRDSITDSSKPALVFEPGPNNQSLFTMDITKDTVGLYLEMQDTTQSGRKYYYKFLLGGDKYSEIIRDRSGSQYSALVNDYDEIDNSTTAHLNMIAGLHPSIDLTPFKNFLLDNGNIVMNRVELVIGNNDTDDENNPSLNSLRFLIPNAQGGRINGAAIYLNINISAYALLANSAYFGNPAGINSVLVSSLNADKTAYQTLITNFSQSLSKSSLFDFDVDLINEAVAEGDGGFLLADKFIFYATDRLQVGQSEFPVSEVKLKAYYTELN